MNRHKCQVTHPDIAPWRSFNEALGSNHLTSYPFTEEQVWCFVADGPLRRACLGGLAPVDGHGVDRSSEDVVSGHVLTSLHEVQGILHSLKDLSSPVSGVTNRGHKNGRTRPTRRASRALGCQSVSPTAPSLLKSPTRYGALKKNIAN